MYAERLPLTNELKDAHRDALLAMVSPGPSWTGDERRQMVEAARAACDCALCSRRKSALSPQAETGKHDGPEGLPVTVIDAIHRIRTDPGRLTRSWFDQVTAEIGQAAYVEMVSVVNASVIIDTLHCALDQPLTDLPDPVVGEPTNAPPGEVVNDGAWVPITRAPRDMADTGLPVVPNIARAMGLVPEAVALFFSTFRPHYALKDIQLSLTQAQAELVAAKVSAVNECFY